ncbi:AI-2E family transporter [Natronomonas salsuginis]|jgi:predicted PurR-regulated permease PerM|uniref:AI-2E family transporter n=1 Tax=Natronomonas salsuginis TaxID=2217661 RepID=A0A4U5JB84_9EURY|nr:AI-2E family transporter [Natronomonas salsuginis]TKR26460.1 AI-2E family transporter [Natronomonas salsuginis]
MNRGQAFLLLVIGLVSVLTLLIVAPFLEYVVASLIFAYVLYPIHIRLERRVGGVASAIILIVGTVVAVIVPLAYIVSVFLADLRAIAAGETALDTDAIEVALSEFIDGEFDLELTELLSLAGNQLIQVLFDGYTGVVTFALQAAIGTALMLFLVYYLLQDGPEFIAWATDTVPLPPHVTDDLLSKIDAMTWGVVIGHISVALVQALIAGVGLWVVGIPNVVFWTFVMAVLSLLPLIGAFLVWGPAAGYLFVVGETTAGVLLALYGIFVVSLFDNYARPIVIDQQARLNPAVILVGVVGGVYAIGFTGLFAGPVVIGVLAATLETFRKEYDRI